MAASVKLGDVVKVARKPDNYESRSSNGVYWPEALNKYIGHSFVVTEFNSGYGPSYSGWTFAPEWLDVLQAASEPEPVRVVDGAVEVKVEAPPPKPAPKPYHYHSRSTAPRQRAFYDGVLEAKKREFGNDIVDRYRATCDDPKCVLARLGISR